jgi:hypothetical protein
MDTNTTDMTIAEALLAAAGIVTVAVESCTDGGCPWCEPKWVPLAA